MKTLEEMQTIIDQMEEDLKLAIFQINEVQLSRHQLLEIIRKENENKNKI